MNLDMSKCPKERPVLLLMPLIEKSEWVSAKWSHTYNCWVSTWGWITLHDPVAWNDLPEVPEELSGERAFVHLSAIDEETQPDSHASVRAA